MEEPFWQLTDYIPQSHRETHRQNQDVKGRALGSLLLTSMGCVCSAKELSTAAVLRRRAAANSARKSSSGSLKSCLLISLSLDIY